jgi:hypothetical protein
LRTGLQRWSASGAPCNIPSGRWAGLIFIAPGVVPHAHVLQLMRQSLAVLQPSLFEGWSMSVEEAKSIGKRGLFRTYPCTVSKLHGGPATSIRTNQRIWRTAWSRLSGPASQALIASSKSAHARHCRRALDLLEGRSRGLCAKSLRHEARNQRVQTRPGWGRCGCCT